MSDNTHVRGAVYDEANPAATSCLQVPGCREAVNKCDVPDCRRIGGPVKSCTWDAENHHFPAQARAGGGCSRFCLQT